MIRRRKPLKRTPIKRKKPVVKKTKSDLTPLQIDRQRHVFDIQIAETIWNKRFEFDNEGNKVRRCAECKHVIHPPWRKHNFSHVLVKKTYKKIRYIELNIDLICWDCHQKWEFGDMIGMKIYDIDKINLLRALDRAIPKFFEEDQLFLYNRTLNDEYSRDGCYSVLK